MGGRPLLYLTPKSFRDVIGREKREYPVWIRNVFVSPGTGTYHDWVIWQFSDNSRIRGITGPVDRNMLRSGLSLADLSLPSGRSEPRE